jgi:hypothetical protein
MQVDFHYYATYALARAAGLNGVAAGTIATCSQYVDDATEAQPLVNGEGCRFAPEVTAHAITDLRQNTNLDDQPRVWVPFHFLPGGEGDELSAKLVCRKNSAIAREMVAHALDQADKPFALELLGITAHVYADTFSHWGFSGVSSRRNRVDGSKVAVNRGTPDALAIMTASMKRFFAQYGVQGGLLENFRKAVSSVANSAGALGHGAVATCPDQPYLAWGFEYEFPDLAGRGEDRLNQLDFREAAQALHAMFSAFAKRRPDLVVSGGGGGFDTIESAVSRIVATVAEKDTRIHVWQAAVQEGRLFHGESRIPEYDSTVMSASRDGLTRATSSSEAAKTPAYRFFQAAAAHRWYVLRDLLPAHGIAIV